MRKQHLLLSIAIVACGCKPILTRDEAKEKALDDSIYNMVTARADSNRKELIDSVLRESALNEANVNRHSHLNALKDIAVDTINLKKLKSNSIKKADEFSEGKFLHDPTSPKFVDRNGIYAYVDETTPMLFFCIQYYAEDWLFIKTMTFNADGENFDYTPEFKTDSGNGMIWEWSNQTVDEVDLQNLVKIATAKHVKVKYFGHQYYKIVNVSAAQQKAIKNMLILYKGLLLGYK